MKYHRLILILALAALIVSLGADVLLAQAPAAKPTPESVGNAAARHLWSGSWRGPGYYLSWIKILIFWLVFLGWVVTTDWVSRDAQEMKLDWRRWNPIVFGVFLGGVLLLWLLPWFWLGFPLLLAAYVAPLTMYILYRNKRVGDHEKVLTRGHLRHWMAQHVRRVGVKMATEGHDPNVSGAPVSVFARGGPDAATDAGRMMAARQSPGLPTARKILSDGLAARASAIMLDYTASTVVVRHMVDGVWLSREPMERETADPALESLKLLCGCKPQDRKGRQEGKFGVDYSVIRQMFFDKVDKAEADFREQTTVELTKKYATDELPPAQRQHKVAREVESRVREKFATPIGPWTPVDKEKLPKLPGVDSMNPVSALEPVKVNATFGSQGTQTGERVVIQFDVKAVKLTRLEDLGMRDKMQAQFKEVLGRSKGFVVLSAVPAGGLRTTTKAVQLEMDRFMREFIAIEDEANRYEEVENVAVTTYKSAAGEGPATVLPKLFRNDPNVVVVRDLCNAESVSCLCREIAREDRLVISTMRAKDCAEALIRVLMLKVPVAEFASQVSAVLCQRLVRKLCDKCKEAYAPAPNVLEQLGIPAGKIRAMYRPPQPKPADQKPDEPCRHCGGAGYKGVTAIFELLVVDDTVRKVLAATPKADLVRQAARKAGMNTLQEEGILLAARGVTSVPELMRVLKQ
jgi:type II secretory ATPase GspE/PulE/Tfp pilus assembly ATPase PilB-like protein